MAILCADTDFLIDLKDQDEKAIRKMEQLESRGDTVSTTSVNVAEFYFGAYRAKDKATALDQADRLLETFPALPLDFAAARLYGQLSEKLKSNIIEPLDLLIASIVIANRQTLLTRNIKHFEMVPGLTVESW
ncbi:PilT-like protein [Candidatus Nitrososphaera gargensis Ga9.2]|uniref:PilT-like protein n=1 Tax=Nitrososphaera gargensis (strain Ga9.2) TaxID=1237085 RepID=K0IBV2_NITGG|nr:type II toxin-antitoxin system VapC family toxin [Candidatus Nitrososphaera gargensis]AFU57030.1 PilT-like protein [Candidatus Nitrososphaera gargensis Ga9.2]